MKKREGRKKEVKACAFHLSILRTRIDWIETGGRRKAVTERGGQTERHINGWTHKVDARKGRDESQKGRKEKVFIPSNFGFIPSRRMCQKKRRKKKSQIWGNCYERKMG